MRKCKSIGSFPILLHILLLFGIAQTATAQNQNPKNLLFDGDMEIKERVGDFNVENGKQIGGTETEKPLHWYIKSTFNLHTIELKPEHKCPQSSGQYGLLVTPSEQAEDLRNTHWDWERKDYSINLQRNTKYQYSFWVKSKHGKGKLQVKIEFGEKYWKKSKTNNPLDASQVIETTKEWKKITGTFTTPDHEEVKNSQFIFSFKEWYFGGSGADNKETYYFDDAALYLASEAPKEEVPAPGESEKIEKGGEEEDGGEEMPEDGIGDEEEEELPGDDPGAGDGGGGNGGSHGDGRGDSGSAPSPENGKSENGKKNTLQKVTSVKHTAYQREIELSWEDKQNKETTWEICLDDKTEPYLKTSEKKVVLEKLKPNTEYTVKIRAVKGDQTSEWHEEKIKTKEIKVKQEEPIRTPYLRTITMSGQVPIKLPLYFNDLYGDDPKITVKIDGKPTELKGQTIEFDWRQPEGQHYQRHTVEITIDESEGKQFVLTYYLTVTDSSNQTFKID